MNSNPGPVAESFSMKAASGVSDSNSRSDAEKVGAGPATGRAISSALMLAADTLPFAWRYTLGSGELSQLTYKSKHR